MSIQNRISTIIRNVHLLIKTCYPDFNFKISYLTIFSKSQNDFQSLRKLMQEIGEESDANNGYKYKLNSPINYLYEKVDSIRIRKPDIHRKEFGCADLVYDRKDYSNFRSIALEKGLDVIVRKDYEMIELSDFKINVYAYLVKEL